MLSLICASLLAFPCHNIAPQLSKSQIVEQFSESYWEFADRWDVFSKGKAFVPFQSGRADADLEKEFAELEAERHAVWYKNPNSVIKQSAPGYEISLPLLFGDLARCKNCIAFGYNNLTPHYNASIMLLGAYGMVACEGPRSKDVPHFFAFLSEYQVTDLVRLTASYEGESKKCHPYWEGLVAEEPDGQRILQVPMGAGIIHPVRYYVEEEWRDHSGIEPKRLLRLLLSVRNHAYAEDTNLAVHCSAGVGRTGTFLAGLATLDAIDAKKPFSIQEIVLRLSLQRFYSVARASQYITLHRLAEEYIRQCSAGS